MSAPQKIKPADRKKITKARKEGKPLAALAARYGVTPQAIYQIAGRVGESIRPYEEEMREEVAAMRGAGMTQRSVVEATGVSRATIQRWEARP